MIKKLRMFVNNKKVLGLKYFWARTDPFAPCLILRLGPMYMPEYTPLGRRLKALKVLLSPNDTFLNTQTAAG